MELCANPPELELAGEAQRNPQQDMLITAPEPWSGSFDRKGPHATASASVVHCDA